MSVYGGKEMAAAFRTVRKNTIQIAEDIPEDKYDFVPAPGVRPVAKTLVHMAISPELWPELAKVTTFVGFDFMSIRERFAAEEAKTRSKPEIVELLRNEGEKFAAWLGSLSDEFFAVGGTDGDGKNVERRFARLLGGKEHEMDHRGEL